MHAMKKRRRNTARRMSDLPRSDVGAVATAGAPGVPEISVFAYTEDALEEKSGLPLDGIAAYRDHPGTVWINVNGLGAQAAIERICGLYAVHPLIIEDIVSTNQRPKFEDFDAYLSIVLKMFYLSDAGDEVITEQVSLVIGKGYVLSFQEKAARDVFEPIRAALRAKRGRLRKLGADYLAYSLVDAVVDHYYVILERLSERLEALEDEVLETPSQGTLQRLHDLRNEIIFLRRSVWPLREVLDKLGHQDDQLIQPTTQVYLRDVYDHTVQIMEQIEVQRDIVTGLLELYLSSVSYKLNEVLKRLTIITTILMPLSVVAGIGGMSEWSMMTGPEHWQIAYPLFCLGLAVIGALTYVFFWIKKWA
jgi:magnesium transporter